ncbi:MAG TPA: hypothetical protein VGR05_07775, partial [Sphingomicrobium sp.]|nr:hypothetical protein [Sphingomicrobium sp.]
TIANEAICQFNGTNQNGSCKTAPLTAANVTVTHTLYCDAATTPTANPDCAPGEVESKWIHVTLWTEYEPLFPLHFSGIDTGGKYRIQAKAGIRTE